MSSIAMGRRLGLDSKGPESRCRNDIRPAQALEGCGVAHAAGAQARRLREQRTDPRAWGGRMGGPLLRLSAEASPMRPGPSLFATAVLWGTACGGAVTPADVGDSGATSGGSSGVAAGSSSGPSSGMGSFGASSGSPMSGDDAAMSGGADAGAPTRPTMGTPATDAAVLLPLRDAAVIRCNNSGPGGGSGGGAGVCGAFAEETCSGVSYSVSCACPQGTCACQGPSSTSVAFAGCPVCPTSPQQLFAACGFPQ